MSTPANSLQALREAIAFQPLGQSIGNLTLGKGTHDGKHVHAALVENRIASGSLGPAECERLAKLFAIVAKEHSPLVLYLDSAGARVSEGLKALGAFRSLYRAGLIAALSKAPIAVVCGTNCYGGASMLAHLAHRRMLSPGTRLAMSGPSIIAGACGMNPLDESFRAMADAAMGPAVRAKTTDANALFQPGDTMTRWLGETFAAGGETPAELKARHDALAQRFEKAADDMPEKVHRRDLDKIYPEGCDSHESRGFLMGKGKRNGAEESFVGIVGNQPLGAQRAWRFANAVWRMAASATPPTHLEVFLDCATHAARLDEEKLILTEYIVDMGYALGVLAARGATIGLTILGKAGGGVYVALAAPAKRVSSVYDAADIQVLPGSALAAILGESNDVAPTFPDYKAAGVADEEIKLGLVSPL
jgi:hypothetical protein